MKKFSSAKKFLAALLTMSMAFSLAACGSDGGGHYPG
ncbi:MAG: YgdI/YgdR family lipoprotein [Clostridium sp.]|nr:YgdI/YgdR family lipoprotein [Clostridium sp.]